MRRFTAKEMASIKRQAYGLASQLPENADQARAILMILAELVAYTEGAAEIASQTAAAVGIK